MANSRGPKAFLGLLVFCSSCSDDSKNCACDASVGGGSSCRITAGGAAGSAGSRAAGGNSVLASAGTTAGIAAGGTGEGASASTATGVVAGGSSAAQSSSAGGTTASGGSSPSIGGTLSVGGSLVTGGTSSGLAVGGVTSSAVSGGGPATSGGVGGTGGIDGKGAAGAAPIVLAVSTGLDRHPISPLIYGVNDRSSLCSNASARFTLCRLGGNPCSTYNWENNASNAGDHGCFQNDAALGTSDVAGATITDLLSAAAPNGAASVVTIPIIDYVAADKLGGTPSPECSGDVRKPPELLYTRFKHNVLQKGTSYAYPPDTGDEFVYQDEFLSYVKGQAGNAEVVITLDNQPELWSQTQAPIHHEHATYQEVVQRNIQAAQMVREVWPGAEITGYGGYGYYAFLNLQDAPNKPGEAQFLDYYLAEMRVADIVAGQRLIDYLDVHWYSEVTVDGVGAINETGPGSTALDEARMQAPRSLWDPNFVEPSWLQWYGPTRLIPWLKGKINAFYPETKIAISAWRYGGEHSISGAIAAADALGVFGREGLGLAAIELPTSDNDFALGAFSVFRNFDGNGSAFGDTSVRAESSSVEKVSVYASADSHDPGRSVIVTINRSAGEQAVSLSISSNVSYTRAARYTLTSAAATPKADSPLFASAANRFDTTLPAYSITVFAPES